MGAGRSAAVKQVSGTGLIGDLPYGKLERLMAKDRSELGREIAREDVWNVVSLICCAAIVGAVATWGPMAITPGRAPSDNAPMDRDLREILMPLSLLLGGIGLMMVSVTWWRQGRLRRYEFPTAAVVTLICCGATLRWSTVSDDVTAFSLVLLWIDVVLAAILLLLQLFASRRGNARVAGFRRLGAKMRELPEAQQRAILAERDPVFDVVLKRDPGMQHEVERARRLPLGDLWKAEKPYRRKQLG
jgi:hypothetical protein